jgi:hypothetical protein
LISPITTAKDNTSFDEEKENIMRAMRAEGFSGYKDLKLVDIPKPTVSDGRVLVRVTAAGVTRRSSTLSCPVSFLAQRRHWCWEVKVQALLKMVADRSFRSAHV